MPTRWQDLTFLAAFWAVALVLFVFGFRLIRYATKTVSEHRQILINPETGEVKYW